MIEALVNNIYLFESYVYHKMAPHIRRNHAVAELTQSMSPNKLSVGERYTFDRLVSFADSTCKKFGLKKPVIHLINNRDTQMTTNGASGLDSKAVTLSIYAGALRFISYDSNKVGIGHEIGHAFAPKIIRKHHLCKEPWFMKLSSIRPECLLGLIALLSVISSAFIGILGSLFGLTISVIMASATIMSHCKKNTPRAIHYRRTCEIVSDEFSLRLLKNLHQAVKSFREMNLEDNFDKSQLLTLNGPDYNKDIAQATGYSHAEYNKVEANEVYSHFWHELWHIPDNDHPSDYTRVQHLIDFYKSGYKNW